jgi:hypothetical protein
MHNHVAHTVDMKQGVNGFRAWRSPNNETTEDALRPAAVERLGAGGRARDNASQDRAASRTGKAQCERDSPIRRFGEAQAGEAMTLLRADGLTGCTCAIRARISSVKSRDFCAIPRPRSILLFQNTRQSWLLRDLLSICLFVTRFHLLEKQTTSDLVNARAR